MDMDEVPQTTKALSNRFGETEPAKWDTREGRNTRQSFDFSQIHVEELDAFHCTIPDVETKVREDALLWQYSGKCPVIVTDFGVHTPKDAGRRERERQAYYALNYLDGEGRVTGWKKL